MGDNNSMSNEFNLEKYLSSGVANIVQGAVKATLTNPQESIFMLKYVKGSIIASKKRAVAEEHGDHIPPFLIASITSQCNLHCAGCYARSNQACKDSTPVCQLTDKEWKRIFLESRDLGIGFILLAGGEPLMREDVIISAGQIPDILFPIFTNGTMINKSYIELFCKYRNLVPILSIEGCEASTNERRGEGVYQKLIDAMNLMNRNKVIFGASITVTTENLKEVTSEEFLNYMESMECKVIFYVEFVPVTEEATELAPGDKERDYMKNRLIDIRSKYEKMVFVSFPGDEKTSGGCLAAGRGFFHINSHGGVEPCPFSPYSDINLRDVSVREALNSKLFKSLQQENVLMEEHSGGCVLFERREQVEALLRLPH